MDMDVTSLREVESQCIARFVAKIRILKAENPGLSQSILRAKAAASLPQTSEKYLMVCSRLTYMGCQPREWK
jgi:hypothetical protein